jgi:hypothetical protein
MVLQLPIQEFLGIELEKMSLPSNFECCQSFFIAASILHPLVEQAQT